MTRRRAPEPTLPGLGAPARTRRRTDSVSLRLVEMASPTTMAWFLSPTGKTAEARWLPFSLAGREVGPDENVFRMPHWAAAERGWL